MRREIDDVEIHLETHAVDAGVFQHDMFAAREIVQVDPVGQGMGAVGKHHKSMLQQFLLMHIAAKARGGAEREIDRAGFKRGAQFEIRHIHRLQHAMGRLRADPGQQMRHKGQFGDVLHGDGDFVAQAGGIERLLRLTQRPRAFEQIGHIGGEREGAVGGGNAFAGFQKQRIAEMGAELLERLAGGALAHPEQMRRLGHAAEAEDGIKHHQQPQIQTGLLQHERLPDEGRKTNNRNMKI